MKRQVNETILTPPLTAAEARRVDRIGLLAILVATLSLAFVVALVLYMVFGSYFA